MKNTNKYLTLILSVLFCGLLLFSFCKKEEHPTIPNVYVDFYVDVSSTIYIELNTIGGWVYLTGGYKGILVYRNSVEDFVAFERTCPYDPDDDDAIIEVESSGLTVIDSCCMSRYLIIDGSVVNGPSTIPLKQYRTTFDGNMLHVFN